MLAFDHHLPPRQTDDKQEQHLNRIRRPNKQPMSQQTQQQGMSNIIQDPNQPELAGNYYHQENDLTGGLPINLDSLRDGPPGTKPFYPYSTLIR